MLTADMAAFLRSLPPDGSTRGPWTDTDTVVLVGQQHHAFTSFREAHSEVSFGEGLLRFVGSRGHGLPSDEWNGPDSWRRLWPNRNNLSVFAYDWMGRQFAFDRNRRPKGEPLVSLLDPADLKVMNSDFTFDAFLGWLAGPDGDGALSKKLYAAWRQRGGAAPTYKQCLSFKQPLVLGGKQVPENLELCDMDVHLHVLQQVNAKIAQLRAAKR